VFSASEDLKHILEGTPIGDTGRDRFSPIRTTVFENFSYHLKTPH
jgi:hypothetical protein